MSITFLGQLNKLTEAYIANKVNPFTACNCFVGTLLNGEEEWAGCRDYHKLINQRADAKFCVRNPISSPYYTGLAIIKSSAIISREGEDFYTPLDIATLEQTFLLTYLDNGGTEDDTLSYEELPEAEKRAHSPLHEEALFIAFSTTLDRLKEIHEAKGEKIEPFCFKKRELV